MIRYRSSFGFNIQANAWPVWRSAQDVRALPPLHDLAVELDPNSLSFTTKSYYRELYKFI